MNYLKITLNVLVTTVLTLILLILSTALLIHALGSLSALSKNIFFYFWNHEFPWMYSLRYTIFASTVFFSTAYMLWFIYNLLDANTKEDTFDLKWLKVPFYLMIFSFCSNIVIRYFTLSEADLLQRALFLHSNIIYLLVFYFILFMAQNFFSPYRKYLRSRYLYIVSMLAMFYYWLNYIAMSYHKQRFFWFLYESGGL